MVGLERRGDIGDNGGGGYGVMEKHRKCLQSQKVYGAMQGGAGRTWGF